MDRLISAEYSTNSLKLFEINLNFTPSLDLLNQIFFILWFMSQKYYNSRVLQNFLEHNFYPIYLIEPKNIFSPADDSNLIPF